MSLIFYDFEVFKHNWLVVFIDPINRIETVIVDDKERLEAFYNEHKGDIWIGYNSGNYDQYVLKGILCGFDPYKVTEWIITKGRKGWEFSNLFRQFPVYNFDISTGFHSLKQLEAFMGNDIRESSVPFNIDRKLTAGEIAETIKYCRHDVEQTIEVFTHRYEMFESQMGLIKAFDLPLTCISKSQTQLAGVILGATRRNYNDEFDVSIPDTLLLDEYDMVKSFFVNAKHDTRLEMMNETEFLKSEKRKIENSILLYKEEYAKKPLKRIENEIKKREKWLKQYPKLLDAADWNNPESFKKWFYSRKLNIHIAGVPHIFAWGGVHGALNEYVDIEGGRYIMADVASLYPSLMIRYNYYSRSTADPLKYKQIYETNLEMKKNKDPLRPAYKLICNKTYGALKDEHNPLYDPLQANNICVAGQLLLLDLIEKLEGVCTLIQSNTDGILIKVEDDKHMETIKEIVSDWEDRTGLIMEFSEFEKVIQKDVNNYCIIDKDGKTKTKGAYIKELNDVDNDLPIVNQAINDYLVKGVCPEVTIGNCNELVMFQKVVKVSHLYKYAMHNGRRLSEKTFRVFASKRKEDGTIYKVKTEGANPQKFGNTPENCFIHNSSMKGVVCPDYLDKQYYVEMAKTRIKSFGVEI